MESEVPVISSVYTPYRIALESPDINLPRDLPRLSAVLKRPSSPKEEELELVLNADNTLGVAFTPRKEGEHLIHLRKYGKDVQISTYRVMVGANEEKVEKVHPMGRTCDVNLDIQGVKLPEDLYMLSAFLKRPNSTKEDPLKIEITPGNSLGVSFVPQEPGEHLITIKKFSSHVKNSPFTVMAAAPKTGNAIGRPRDVGLDIPGLKLPDDCRLLSASLKRPSGKTEEPVLLALNSDDTLSVSFTPKETGEHFVTVKKSGKHVNGSPFAVMVSGSGSADHS